MRLDFLQLASEERRLYIEQAALRSDLSPVILEKDFWVCWLLAILFESEFGDSLVRQRPWAAAAATCICKRLRQRAIFCTSSGLGTQRLARFAVLVRACGIELR